MCVSICLSVSVSVFASERQTETVIERKEESGLSAWRQRATEREGERECVCVVCAGK